MWWRSDFIPPACKTAQPSPRPTPSQVDGADTYGPFPVGRNDVTFTGRIVRFDVHIWRREHRAPEVEALVAEQR